jgi:nicotinamidase-related amidase
MRTADAAADIPEVKIICALALLSTVEVTGLSMPVSSKREPIQNAVHLALDMQNIFARGGIWETPWMERVLPTLIAITNANPARTVLTRFITPVHGSDRPGRWQKYYQKWEHATRSRLPATHLDIVPALARFVPPATVIDKPAYSAFSETNLSSFLLSKSVSTLIVTGAETDVCVLSTVLDAVDIGFRVVVVEDGLCSSSDEGHDALMTLYRKRYSEQIELRSHAEVLELWQDE